MRQMSIGQSRSHLTSAGSAREHHAFGRPRIHLEFSSAGRRRSPEAEVLVMHPVGLKGVSGWHGTSDEADDAAESSSFYIEVFFKAVSAALAQEGAMSAIGALDAGRADAKSLKLRLSEALDVDLAVSLGEAKNTPKGYAPLVRLLKSWTKKSGNSR